MGLRQRSRSARNSEYKPDVAHVGAMILTCSKREIACPWAVNTNSIVNGSHTIDRTTGESRTALSSKHSNQVLADSLGSKYTDVRKYQRYQVGSEGLGQHQRKLYDKVHKLYLV